MYQGPLCQSVDCQQLGTQWEVSSRLVSEASSIFIAVPYRLLYHLSYTTCQVSGSTGFS